MKGQVEEVWIAWIAGLLEGEGCFDIQKDKRWNTAYPRVRCKMTDKDVIYKAAGIMGMICDPYEEKLSSGKTAFVIQLTGQKAIDIMEAILPYMGKRRGFVINNIITLARNLQSALNATKGSPKARG